MSFYSKEIFSDKIFYHIYPLGMGNCPHENDFSSPAGFYFQMLTEELPRIKALGCNALYIGPVFESTKHGYDTLDYFHIDRRLGNNEVFKKFCCAAHEQGFAVVLDAVFNHTGRHFFAFKDIQRHGRFSKYASWYKNLDFERRSCYGDSFDYEGWAGCKDLVKLNLENDDVINHLLGAVKFWIEEFKIDGLRLDAADVLSHSFLKKLSSFCRSLKSDFWLMGEVVHGNYNDWTNSSSIDSVTNYQIYKSLWSAVDSKNFFELSYNLDREFGKNGMYKYAPLYNFLENHDVNRLASVLQNPQEDLYLLYALMFAIPGIPSIYYGGEWGLCGKRCDWGDYELRPCIPPFADIPDYAKPRCDTALLGRAISTLSKIRSESSALQKGDYVEEFVSNGQFAFSRNYDNGSEKESVIVVCNIESNDAEVHLKNQYESGGWKNLLTGKNYGGKYLRDISIGKKSVMILCSQKTC
ncbi:MAG TPA: alpha-amylase [Treponema sp.]|nr:alpha-amylase [Treponema sp.]